MFCRTALRRGSLTHRPLRTPVRCAADAAPGRWRSAATMVHTEGANSLAVWQNQRRQFATERPITFLEEDLASEAFKVRAMKEKEKTAFTLDAVPTSWICSSCAHSHDAYSFHCTNCDALMEADYGETTHFQLLGLLREFEVDRNDVDLRFKTLQRRLHPDLHSLAPTDVQDLAMRHSARLNEVVADLRSPLRRATYWMRLNGVSVLEEEHRMDDMEMMMEVMELNEQIADATTRAEVDTIASANEASISAVEAKLASIFSKKDWDAARVQVERLQMYTKIGERLRDWRGPSE